MMSDNSSLNSNHSVSVAAVTDYNFPALIFGIFLIVIIAGGNLLVCVRCFLFCWTPYFVVHTTRALCVSCSIPSSLISLVTWLGYVNSALNPIIYTIFNTEFRKLFKKVLSSSCF